MISEIERLVRELRSSAENGGESTPQNVCNRKRVKEKRSKNVTKRSSTTADLMKRERETIT